MDIYKVTFQMEGRKYKKTKISIKNNTQKIK